MVSSELVWSLYQNDIFDDIRDGEHHTVVKALAGASKTTTIVEGLKHVPKKKNALFCAFNKRIVQELEDRIPASATIATLHSLGFRAVNDAYGKQRVDPNRSGALLGKMLSNRKQGAYELKGRLAKTVSLCKSLVSYDSEAVDKVLDLFNIDTSNASLTDVERDREEFIKYVLTALDECKKVKGAVDFDDMTWLPVVNKLPLDQYDRVFIDEMQDLTPVQLQLSIRACRKKGRICAVGDENQGIYAWRGADAGGLTSFAERFNARVLPLPICYRCPSSVVEQAKIIVPEIEPSPFAERGSVSDILEVDMLKEAAPGDFILSRLNAPLLGLCFNFLANDQKVIIQGRDIGANLASFVRKSNCSTVNDLMNYTDNWRISERERLLNRKEPREREAEAVEDRANCIAVLARNARTVQDVLAAIDNMFGDATDQNSIILSSVHRAKGLEANRVFILLRSFRIPRPLWGEEVHDSKSQEELNIAYVAITRAKEELFYVVD